MTDSVNSKARTLYSLLVNFDCETCVYQADKNVALQFRDLTKVHIPSREYDNVDLRFSLTNFRESN